METAEKNTVRFLDNFSHGNRGSITAEVLLDAGYSVIFLHRRKSLRPFLRSLQQEAILGKVFVLCFFFWWF
jgi:phosphopantothenate-cysteine ligase